MDFTSAGSLSRTADQLSESGVLTGAETDSLQHCVTVHSVANGALSLPPQEAGQVVQVGLSLVSLSLSLYLFLYPCWSCVSNAPTTLPCLLDVSSTLLCGPSVTSTATHPSSHLFCCMLCLLSPIPHPLVFLPGP